MNDSKICVCTIKNKEPSCLKPIGSMSPILVTILLGGSVGVPPEVFIAHTSVVPDRSLVKRNSSFPVTSQATDHGPDA